MKLSDQLSLINKARKNVKESQTYKDLCKEWQADPDIIDYISICFGDLPVSARTTHGIITLNKSLIEKDLNELSHYIAHEIDHVFSQCLGDKSTKGSSNSEDYLDNPHEIDAFQTQVKFIAETEDQNEAEKYVEKVLKHHDLSGKDKKEKKEELLSEAVNNLLKFIKLASMSLYEALNLFGLSENYTLEEVNNKYKKLIFENHPDRNTSPDAHINTIKIQQAKEVLLSLLKNQRKDKNEEKQENSTEEPVKPVNRENIPNPINLNWEEVDTSWQHKYYTPLDNYTDAEKFEYYTNPEIQKQYEQEFAQEQEYAQEDYEKSKEQEWEYQQDIAYDYSSDLIDKLEILQFPPSKLTDLFGRKRSEEEWKLFNINSSVPSVQNKNKYEKLKERIIHKHIDAFLDFAILKYITENHPNYIKKLLLNDFYQGAIFGMEKAGIHSNSIPATKKELPFQDFVELLSLNKLSIKFLHQRPIDEQIKIINENWNLVLNQLLNTKNIVDLTGWNSEEINQLILDKLSSEEPTKQIENIKTTILRNIAYKKRSKFSNLKLESAKKPFQLSLDFPEPTISKEDVEKFLAELGDDKVQPWRHKRDHQKLGPREKSTRLERLKELLDSIKKEAGLLKFDQELYNKLSKILVTVIANKIRDILELRLKKYQEFKSSSGQEYVEMLESALYKYSNIKDELRWAQENYEFPIDISFKDPHSDIFPPIPQFDIKIRCHQYDDKNWDNSTNNNILNFDGDQIINEIVSMKDFSSSLLYNKINSLNDLINEKYKKISKIIDSLTSLNNFGNSEMTELHRLLNIVNKFPKINFTYSDLYFIKNDEVDLVIYFSKESADEYYSKENWAGLYSPESSTLYKSRISILLDLEDIQYIKNVDQLNYLLFNKLKTLRHEIQHHKQFSEKYNQEISGIPSKKIRNNIVDPHGRNLKNLKNNPENSSKINSQRIDHELRDVEFYTRLSDEVAAFNFKLKNYPLELKKILAKSWVNIKLTQDDYDLVDFHFNKNEKMKQYFLNMTSFSNSDWFKILSEKDFPRWKKAVKEFSKAVLNDEIKAEASFKSAGLIKVDPTLIKEVFDWAAGLFATSVRKTQLQKIKEVNISEIEEENSLLGGISAFDDVLSDTKLLKQDLVERYLLVKETNKYQLVESNKKINQKYFESLLVRFYFQDSEEETGSVGSFEDETLELYFDPDFIDSVDEFNSALSEIKRVIIHELGHYYQALGQIENQNLSSSPTQKDKYYLNPDEFYTLLQDEVTFFNRKFENAPDPVKKLAALFWVDSAPKKLKQFSDKLDIYQFTTAKYFKVLKKKDFDRWKKAVKEFMKAINIIE